MTDLDTLKSLRERVLAASGPEWEIDAELALLAGLPQSYFGGAFNEKGQVDGPECFDDATWAGGGKTYEAPEFTASIDAALALVERMLPGWCWGFDQLDGEHCAYVGSPAADETSEHWAVQGKGASAPLAILAALLSALIAQAEARA